MNNPDDYTISVMRQIVPSLSEAEARRILVETEAFVELASIIASPAEIKLETNDDRLDDEQFPPASRPTDDELERRAFDRTEARAINSENRGNE